MGFIGVAELTTMGWRWADGQDDISFVMSLTPLKDTILACYPGDDFVVTSSHCTIGPSLIEYCL
jgi:hypothetical protein